MINVHITQIPSAYPRDGVIPRCSSCRESIAYSPSWLVIEQCGQAQPETGLLCTSCFGVSLDRLANRAYDAIEIGV